MLWPGLSRGGSGARIGVLLPANSPCELAGLCPFIEVVYPASPMLAELPGSLEHVPREWDWIVENRAATTPRT
jgi:hypothetical protein